MEKKIIPFNKPYFTGNESKYMEEAVKKGHISGNGYFTKKCHEFFLESYDFYKCLLTTSCTDALEMAAILIDIKEGDEVIMPSYTFVSTANAFILRGAKIIFADSLFNHPNIDHLSIEKLISPKTKAIVVVHYAGFACEMSTLQDLCKKFNIYLIEDAAQAIDNKYDGKPLGSFGDLAAFSFHETKNIISGEGGMLVINNKKFERRAEILWEKGTNRSSFFRGEVDKYGWVDVGSSYLPSDLVAAFLYAQLENLDKIQERRKLLWNQYNNLLEGIEVKGIQRPVIPNKSENNAHMYYLICEDLKQRTKLISDLKVNGFNAVFHYLSLHKSPFYSEKHDDRELVYADKFTDCLVRLPFFYELDSVSEIVEIIKNV